MKPRALIIVVCICAVAFVLGIIQLFQVRFEQGDVYPPYSSLRADPLGAMALFESLERMPGVVVRRDFSARNQLPESRDTTYLHLAADAADWRWMPDSLVKEIEGFLTRGGRLVITCKPETTGNTFFSRTASRSHGTNSPIARPKKGDKGNPAEDPLKPHKPGEGNDDEEENLARRINLQDRWGFGVTHERLPQGEDDAAAPVTVTNISHSNLPSVLAWHSATLFTSLSTNWQVLYMRGSNAVVIERRFGSGSVVLASDSFFVSNEALLSDRHADLLAWLVGPNRLVVFDEAHLGVVEEPGVATLMRRYRLHGLIAGLALLMGLFVWKNSLSLVPPPKRAQDYHFIAGRDSALGFVNLLRRSIPTGEILKVCYEQWAKSAAARPDLGPSRIEQAKQAVEAEISKSALERNPVAAYQQISKALKPGVPAAPASPSTHQTNA